MEDEQQPEAPAEVAPSGEVRPDPLAAARAAQKKRYQLQLDRVAELCEQYKDKSNSTSLIAKDMGVSVEAVQKWRRDLGMVLKRGDAKPRDDWKKREPSEKPLWEQGWSMLKFFDTMRKFFQQVEAEESDVSTEGDGEPVEKPVEADGRLTWLSWRVFLAGAFGIAQTDLATDQSDGTPVPEYAGINAPDVPRGAGAIPAGASHQEIFERCTGRKIWPTVQAKIVSLVVGRRGGKSYITALIGLYLALCKRYKLNLGTNGMVMILARDKEQAGVIRRYILAFLRTPLLAPYLKGEPSQKLIELTNDITIEVRAVGEAGTRGYTVVAALLDEIAFWPTDPESAKQDKKVIRALRPAMLGIPGSMLVALSSPYAKRGELYENYRKGYAKDDQTRHFVWQADTLSMRPDNDAELLEEIRSEYEEDPESAKAEYGAEFRSDLESIFSRAAIEAVSVLGRGERAYRPGENYFAFVDPSGGSSDSYVLAIGHRERRVDPNTQEKYTFPVVDKIREWTAKFDPQAVSAEVVEECKSYRITSVTGDAYGGEWPREPLKKKGIQYVVSDKTRSELYLEMVPMVNSKRCELLDPSTHRRGVNQFANLERRVGRSGRDSVDHPSGQHDDVANAVAGLVVHLSNGAVRRMGAVW